MNRIIVTIGFDEYTQWLMLAKLVLEMSSLPKVTGAHQRFV